MALYSHGPIQLWPYIAMALYSHGPVQLWPYTGMAHAGMALYSYGLGCLLIDAGPRCSPSACTADTPESFARVETRLDQLWPM